MSKSAEKLVSRITPGVLAIRALSAASAVEAGELAQDLLVPRCAVGDIPEVLAQEKAQAG
jgi:hypothetical protein